MRALFVASLASVVVLVGCSSSDDTPAATSDTGSSAETSVTTDTSTPDTTVDDTGSGTDSAMAGDAPSDGDGGTGCPASWTIAPVVDPSIAIPDGGGNVLLHAAATGTQDYACVASTSGDAGTDASGDGGTTTYAWTLTGPEADLKDCMMAKIGSHFASDAGATAPEWMTLADGTHVIAKRNAAFTPDGGTSIPWLLLEATSHSGTGTLSKTLFIQRVNTTGGKAPATGCDSTTVGATTKVSYTADYYFFGTP
ncbi:MAG: DUF3455 domain-containing protein [Polyangiales bacterium]